MVAITITYTPRTVIDRAIGADWPDDYICSVCAALVTLAGQPVHTAWHLATKTT